MTFVTLLTGASRGIGAAIAEIYLKKSETNHLIAVARSKAPLDELVQKYGDERVGIVVGDATDPEISEKAVKLALSKFQRLDAVIANAGVLDPVSPIAEANLDSWKKLYEVNLFSIVGLTQKALPELRKAKGKVLVVSSGASEKPYDGWAAYGSSKAAANHFIASLADEEPDISAISIAPGVVDTEMQKDIREKFASNMPRNIAKFMKLHKDNELLAPEIPASVYVNLALNGWNKAVDGKYLRFDDERIN